jgi:hypothetical protein
LPVAPGFGDDRDQLRRGDSAPPWRRDGHVGTSARAASNSEPGAGSDARVSSKASMSPRDDLALATPGRATIERPGPGDRRRCRAVTTEGSARGVGGRPFVSEQMRFLDRWRPAGGEEKGATAGHGWRPVSRGLRCFLSTARIGSWVARERRLPGVTLGPTAWRRGVARPRPPGRVEARVVPDRCPGRNCDVGSRGAGTTRPDNDAVAECYSASGPLASTRPTTS